MLWLKEAKKCKRKRKKMSDIIVQFKPKGDKQLIRAIKLLTNASDELNDELKFQQKQSRKTGNAFVAFD